MELPLGMLAVKDRAVLVIEDEPWVREDLVQGLTGVFGQVTACKTVREAMDFIRRGGQVDAALVDLALPDGSGLEVIAALRMTHPRVVCVVLSVFDEDPQVVAALRVGADGYLLKETPIKRIAAALQEALDGGAPLSPRIAKAVVQSFRPQLQVGGESRTLTRRERDVLTLLAKGLSYEEVGRALGIRLGTVQSHIKRMYTRLDINTKAEAALIAAQLGLV